MDYVGTSSLALNGATIKDAQNNAAVLTLASPAASGSLGANAALVVETTNPTVTGVDTTETDGSFGEGETIDITITFDEAVTVTGTPQLTLETGGSDAVVNYYSSGSTTTVLTFVYTIADGEASSDLDYVGTSSLALNSGTIKDAQNNAAVLTLASPAASGSLGANAALVVETTNPTVTGVDTTETDGTFGIGQTIDITVTFDEAVVVTGTPQLTLETGGSDAVVDYSSGTGSTVLTFVYTVASGHVSSDLDYVGTSSLALNSGTIKDAQNNAAVLTLASPAASGSLGANAALVIDTDAPAVTGVNTTETDGSFGEGETIDITITFDEAVTVTGTPQLTLETGGSDAVVNYSSGSTTTVLTFVYTIADGEASSDLDYVGTSSLALNSGTIKSTSTTNDAVLTLASPAASGSLGANAALVVETTNPTVTGVDTTETDGSFGEGETIDITITFDEAVTVTGTPQLTLETGGSDAVVNYSSGSTTTVLTFVYTIADGEASSDLDYVGTSSLALNGATIKDAQNNAAVLTLASPAASGSLGANAALVVETTNPTVTGVDTTETDGSFGEGETIDITITFDEAVTVTGTPQLTLETGGSDAVVNYSSGSTTTVLTFVYTIADGEASSDLDYVGTSSLST